MFHGYNDLYLNKARNSLAVMLDLAVNDLHRNAGAFFDLFISSGTAALFERGDVRIIAGMSGIELAYHVLEASGLQTERISYRYTSGRRKEYWTGWALAYYQWERALPFRDIISSVPLTDIADIIDRYREEEIRALSEGLSWMDTLKVPDHMSEDNYMSFAMDMDRLIYGSAAENSKDDEVMTALKRLRLQNGLSQSGLAAASGVPVRTIQQYEQRQKDINKAGFDHIIKLAAALSCEPVMLIERVRPL